MQCTLLCPLNMIFRFLEGQEIGWTVHFEYLNVLNLHSVFLSSCFRVPTILATCLLPCFLSCANLILEFASLLYRSYSYNNSNNLFCYLLTFLLASFYLFAYLITCFPGCKNSSNLFVHLVPHLLFVLLLFHFLLSCSV